MIVKGKEKYLIVLEEGKRTALKKAERQLSMKLTSSEELGAKVRAHNIYESGNGLYLKNLGVVIVEDAEDERLNRLSAKRNSAVLHWEREREFSTQSELDLIARLKSSLNLCVEQIGQLEELVLQRSEHQPIVAELTAGLSMAGLGLSKYTGEGVKVCILDTGFYLAHPDFKERSIDGKSFIKNEKWDLDGNGHGTHCAGVAIGGHALSDGIRYGIASKAMVYIGKVLGDKGFGSTSIILDAIDKALEDNQQIISLSLGSPVAVGEAPSILFERVGRRALDKNCLIIAAAGNDSRRPKIPKPVSSPANVESIMAVAALTKNLGVAEFSNAGLNASDGGRVDLSALGVGVYSSYSKLAPKKKLYATMNGTSMATPLVAGLAALYREAYPNLSAEAIWLKMEKQARHLPGQLFRDVGQGLVQAPN